MRFKIFLQRKLQAQIPSLVHFAKHLRKNSESSRKQEGNFPNSFHETSITLIPKPAKDVIRKKKTYKSIHVMKLNVKNKILVN